MGGGINIYFLKGICTTLQNRKGIQLRVYTLNFCIQKTNSHLIYVTNIIITRLSNVLQQGFSDTQEDSKYSMGLQLMSYLEPPYIPSFDSQWSTLLANTPHVSFKDLQRSTVLWCYARIYQEDISFKGFQSDKK